jgi:molybdopterin biosynthesis enzyme MoaB
MPSSIRAVVITVSDASARGERTDESGAALVQLLREAGAEIAATSIVVDSQ